jgi:hypothetical protein
MDRGESKAQGVPTCFPSANNDPHQSRPQGAGLVRIEKRRGVPVPASVQDSGFQPRVHAVGKANALNVWLSVMFADGFINDSRYSAHTKRGSAADRHWEIRRGYFTQRRDEPQLHLMGERKAFPPLAAQAEV